MDYKGISFSGGEPFLVFNRLIEWLQFFKTAAPSIYYWVYTNGLEVTEERLKRLSDCGLDEIRFNIAAVGYDDPRVLNAVALAAEIIPHVAVEIPSIPEDYERLINVLPALNSAGVKYLNLHEYIIMNLQAVSSHPAHKKVRIVDLEDELVCHVGSLANTERIIELCRRRGFDFIINNCSMDAKARQMQQRRRMMSRLAQTAVEDVDEEGFLITVLDSPHQLSIEKVEADLRSNRIGKYEKYFAHPTHVHRRADQENSLIELTFSPPMILGGVRKFRGMKVLNIN
jgi:pyruvate formate-lyase activating enzyme-like uncharacterized protein